MHKTAQDAAASREALRFFEWAYSKGDKMAEDLDYVPMPDKVVAAIKKSWSAQIKDKEGKPLLALSN
jgi:phosphate transport system substrate-binding protein